MAITAGRIHIELEPPANGLTAPNWGAFAADDFSQLFVTDQNGVLWAVDLSTGDKRVFLDVGCVGLTDLGILLSPFGPQS